MSGLVELRDVLLGAGAFVGLGAAGLGACRFFVWAARSVLVLPGQMERCANALERSVAAMENHNSLDNLVVALTKQLVATRDDLNRAKAEQDLFRREIRILSRRMEGEKFYAQITD